MKQVFLIIVASLFFVQTYGQMRGEITIPHGRTPTTTGIDSLQFVLKNFSTGTVFFDNGDKSESILNIGTLDQRVHFINEKGDTLVVVNEKDITAVIAGNRLFKKIKNGLYVEILDLNREVSLGVAKRLIFYPPKKRGAYEIASETISSKSYSTTDDGTGKSYMLNNDQKIPYSFNLYPFLYSNEKVYSPSKRAFKRLFPDKKREIEEYLKANKVSFENMSDIRALYYICIDE